MRAIMRALVATLGMAMPVGCATTTPNTNIAADHPANPGAPESPLPAPSDTLGSIQPTGPLQAATYTCPMHKEVVSNEPGKCPKCGMKLVPKAATAQSQPAPDHSGHGGHQ
jgi:hypothetical protein